MDKKKKKILVLLNETSKVINPLIQKYTRVSDRHLQEIIDHALQPKSYKERSLLVRLSCESIGGDFNKIRHAAVAVELFHLSTLVIDDFLDESPLRSNKKTVQIVYGNKNAVIIGELLNSLAFLALMDISNSNANKNTIKEVVKLFKETQRNIYYGQYLDLSFEHNENINENHYLNMISKTTASLITCCLKAGSILCGGNKEQIISLARYGDYLGKAFQIRDDLVEIIGDPDLIGKQLGGDIKQGKMRLPLIHALSNSKKLDQRYLINIIKKKKLKNNDLSKCIEILINNNSIEYSKNFIKRLCKEAVLQLRIHNSHAKNALIDFADMIATSW